MRSITTGSPESDRGILSLLLGFAGVTAVFMLLPKTVKYVIRRFVLGTIAEIVAVLVTALLTEKVVNLIGQTQDDSEVAELRE